MSGPSQLNTVDGLVQLSFLVHGTLERRAAERGLSIVQARLLGVLRDREPTMNELAKLLGLDKSSVTGLVQRAERRGLVARIASRSDKRAVHVSLTGRGRALAVAAAARFEADISAILSCLAQPDQEALCALVSRVLVAQATARQIHLLPATTTSG